MPARLVEVPAQPDDCICPPPWNNDHTISPECQAEYHDVGECLTGRWKA